MKLSLIAFAVLALAGCATRGETAWKACEQVKDYKAWGDCFNSRMPQVASVSDERSRRREEAVDDAVAAGLLIDYATRPRSCMAIGGIVTC